MFHLFIYLYFVVKIPTKKNFLTKSKAIVLIYNNVIIAIFIKYLEDISNSRKKSDKVFKLETNII